MLTAVTAPHSKTIFGAAMIPIRSAAKKPIAADGGQLISIIIHGKQKKTDVAFFCRAEIGYFFFGLCFACAKSDPATVFSSRVDFLLASSLPALLAGFFPVVMFNTPADSHR
jgi:hypothetical protein